jgi:hypothetical protein
VAEAKKAKEDEDRLQLEETTKKKKAAEEAAK